jgi:hypothetical protein
MSNETVSSKLEIILSLAAKVESYFTSQSTIDTVTNDLIEIVDKHKALCTSTSILNDSTPMYILAKDPKALIDDFVSLLRSYPNKEDYNPIVIITKLFKKEYSVDVDGNKLLYIIQSDVVCQEMLKSIICRQMCSVKSYFSILDNQCFINNESYSQIEYESDLSMKEIKGGKSKKQKPKVSSRLKMKTEIINALLDFIKGDPYIRNGVILINSIQDINDHALDLIYSEYKIKEAIVKFLNIYIMENHNTYVFKSFLHSGFSIPQDFRLKKYSCLINEKATNQGLYLLNMYNSAVYDPIPAIVINGIQCAHPLIRLRFLYIDEYIAKLKSVNSSVNKKYITQVCKDILDFNKIPTWKGFYIDENYERNQLNMTFKMDDQFINIIL